MRVATTRKGVANGGRSFGLVGDIFRLALAAALVAGVALFSANQLRAKAAQVEDRRLQDRIDLASAFAAPLQDWLGTAREAAKSFASSASPTLAGWNTYRVGRDGTYTGGSGAFSGTVQSHPCPTGAGLRDLVDAATQAAGPVALVLSPPGDCGEALVIGAAAPSAGGTAVVTGDVNAFLAQAAVASHLKTDIRTFIVDPAGTRLSPETRVVDPVPPYLASFVAPLSSGTGRSARSVTDVGRTKVVDAGAPVGGGWSVVVEQDANVFDVGLAIGLPDVAIKLAAALLVILLGLLGVADVRRRGALRRSEAHTAAFLAVLGHELRTPLTVIKGFVDTLSSRWNSLADAQRHDLVDRLPQQSRRLNRVVERLLLAANLQAGSAPLPTLSAVDVTAALERVTADFAPIAPLHEFVVDTTSDVTARADAKTLDQILDQLVDNAVRYAPSGGVVRLAAVRRRGRIEISIEDEGIGLPADATHIFSAFAQGEGVDRRVNDEGGVGVGLYIARTLCEQLGGSVRAERRAQTGARFVVSLRPSRQRVAERV